LRKTLLLSFMLLAGPGAQAQQRAAPGSVADKMQWFADAKLGIFIHWASTA